MTFDVAGPGPVLLSLPAWTPGRVRAELVRPLGRPTSRRRAGGAAAGLGQARLRHLAGPAGGRQVGHASGSTTWPTRSTTRWPGPGRTSCSSTAPTCCPTPRAAASTSRRRSRSRPSRRGSWPPACSRCRSRPGTYREGNYHDLVDKPFFVGRIDFDSTQVAGRWTRLATYPAGALAGPARRAALGRDRQGDPGRGRGVPGDAVAALHRDDDLRLGATAAAARSSTPTRTSGSTTRGSSATRSWRRSPPTRSSTPGT